MDNTRDKSAIAQLDAEKESDLAEMAISLKIAYECQFNQIKSLAKKLKKGEDCSNVDQALIREATTFNEFLDTYPPRIFNKKKAVPYQAMVNSILDDRLFGFACVSISTPDELKDFFEDFPLVIKHVQLTRSEIGEMMGKVAEEQGLLKEPQDCLTNSYFGSKIWLMTPFICFMVERGMKLEAVHEVAQFDGEKVFEFFGQKVTEMRQRGDVDESLALLSNIYKLLGNCGYIKNFF